MIFFTFMMTIMVSKNIFELFKALFAQENGCIGVVLFSDSADYAPEWADVYPDDWFLPGQIDKRQLL